MKHLRLGVCTLLAFTVLAHGVVEVWSATVFEVGAGALFLLWGFLAASRRVPDVRLSVLLWPPLGFVGVGVLQLAARLTVSPFLTKVELLKFTACFLVLFLAVQSFRERRDFIFFVGFLICFVFLVSLFGIVQHFASNGKLYWVRPVTENMPFFGPYVNPDDFAGFVELITPLGLALLAFRGVRRDLLPLTGLCAILPIGALVLTGSRAGMLSFAFEVGLLLLMVWARRSQRARLGVFGLIFLGATALIAWLGTGRAIERFSDLRHGEVTIARRWSMVKGATHIFLAHPIEGSGIGTLVIAFPRYESMYDGRLVDHAHNDYIEVLADSGILGGACWCIFLFFLYRRSLERLEAEQGHFSRAYHTGAMVACSGILLHSFVDFNLQIPSNLLLFLLEGFLATSPVLLSGNQLHARQRSARAPKKVEAVAQIPVSTPRSATE